MRFVTSMAVDVGASQLHTSYLTYFTTGSVLSLRTADAAHVRRLVDKAVDLRVVVLYGPRS